MRVTPCAEPAGTLEKHSRPRYNAGMGTVDQRILIPMPQQVVWEFLSQLLNNSLWQQDCAHVSFLSSKHTGVGTRWRSTGANGHDTVYEVTSWYNGLGYEYRSIDGGQLRGVQGRLRLQEIPEGTIVQWTFSFDSGGALSGLRGVSRKVDATMAASLKTLYRQLKSSTPRPETGVTPSLMQDAPDVSGRTSYQPRHTPVFSEPNSPPPTAASVPTLLSEPPVVIGDAQSVRTVDLPAEEPPVTLEDTRPRPAISAEAPAETAPASEAEPDFLSDLPPAPRPRPSDVETMLLEPPAELELPQAEPAEVSAPPVAAAPPVTPAPPPPPVAPPAPAAAAAEGRSIWEVFGVQRPEALLSAIPDAPASPTVTPVAQRVSTPETAHTRIGLRARQRRSAAGVRYP